MPALDGYLWAQVHLCMDNWVIDGSYFEACELKGCRTRYLSDPAVEVISPVESFLVSICCGFRKVFVRLPSAAVGVSGLAEEQSAEESAKFSWRLFWDL